MSETYKVFMRTQEFCLTKDQIEFDSPNFFTTCFLGDFKEARSKTVTLNRNPHLFAIIVDYLTGYEILPISSNALPPTMSAELTFRNLLADAAFYGFSELHTILTAATLGSEVCWPDYGDKIVLWEDIIDGKLSNPIEWTDDGLISLTEHDGLPKPVLVSARNKQLTLHGIMATAGQRNAIYRLCLSSIQDDRLQKHYSNYLFPWDSRIPSFMTAEVFQDSLLQINGDVCRFDDFPRWWVCKARERPMDPPELGRIFDNAFPIPYDRYSLEKEVPSGFQNRGMFHLLAEELLFTITADNDVPTRSRKDKIQLKINILNAKTRTRASLLHAIQHPPRQQD